MDAYWQSQIDPFTQAARNIGARLAMQPQLRAQAALRQQQAIYNAAHAAQAQAAAELAQARTQQISDQGAGEQAMLDSGNRLAVALRTLATKPSDPDATADAVSEMGHYFQKNPQEAANGLRTLVATLAARAGGTTPQAQAMLEGDANKVYATDQDNATQLQVNQANNQIKLALAAAEPVVVPNNGTLTTKDGKVLAQGAATVGIGGTRFAPVGSDDDDDNSQLEVEGSGLAPAPKTSAADATRADLVRSLLEKVGEGKMDKALVNSMLKTYDAHMLDHNPPGVVGAVPAAAPGTVRNLANSLAAQSAARAKAAAPAAVDPDPDFENSGVLAQPSAPAEPDFEGSGAVADNNPAPTPAAPASRPALDPGQIPVYPDEASARAQGHSSGAIVRLPGVGIVQLR